ncbi:MAG: S8 family serine peptidase, partial [Bacteroidota bacterium]
MDPKVKHYLFHYLLVGALLAINTPLFAQKVASKKANELENLPGKSTSLQRLSSGLQQIHQFQVHQKQASASSSIIDQKAIDHSFIIRKNQISVDLIAKSDPQLLLAELGELSFTHLATFGKTISGRIDLDQLELLATLDALQYARPVYKANRRVGSVDSQGDQAQYSDQGRSNYSVDGDGIKIGLLSDSYNTLSGAAAGVASGDLPGVGNPNGYTTPVTVLLEYSATGSDEARAMAEIVHDVAPAAELYARTAFEGEADFAQGIIDLEAAGCKIIVDDIGYFAEPFFQDGIIAQAADQVVNDGAIYFSAAGNSGNKSYEVAGFNDSGFTLGGSPLHDFDPSSNTDYTQSITIPAGVTFQMSLQWDDPFGSLPGAVDAADTDIDIRLYNSSFSLVAYSETANVVSGDPLEIMSYTNNGATQQFNIVILHYSGPTPNYLKYVSWTNSITIDEYDTESSTIVGHANSEGAIAIGAAAWYNTPAYGASPATVNDFSSLGGTPIFFDKLGNPIATITRQKPEFVGPDGANTTFFGTDIAIDADAFPNFFGTSAAAPHAAGAAALIVEMGATTRTEVLNAFINTSEDMDNPHTGGGDVGFDFATGFGMAQTNSAITHFVNLPV